MVDLSSFHSVVKISSPDNMNTTKLDVLDEPKTRANKGDDASTAKVLVSIIERSSTSLARCHTSKLREPFLPNEWIAES
jgi:hypothetical protein